MGNNNGPIRARMFVGGLKSLFVDMAETLDEVEKTGRMPVDMLQSLLDVKAAIDMTLSQLTKSQVRCCEHAPDCPHEEDEECAICGEYTEDCQCDDDLPLMEEEEEEIPPPAPPPVKKSTAKVVKTNKTRH